MSSCLLLSHFSHVQLCAALWTVATRLLGSWDSLGKNSVGRRALLQGVLQAQGVNLRPLHVPALAGGLFTVSVTWEVSL